MWIDIQLTDTNARKKRCIPDFLWGMFMKWVNHGDRIVFYKLFSQFPELVDITLPAPIIEGDTIVYGMRITPIFERIKEDQVW